MTGVGSRNFKLQVQRVVLPHLQRVGSWWWCVSSVWMSDMGVWADVA